MFSATVALDIAVSKLFSSKPSTVVTSFQVNKDDLHTFATTGNDGARVKLLKSTFKRLHNAAPDAVAVAGGRANLIGEHVDYPDVQFNGTPTAHLFSMGGAIQNNYLVAANKRDDNLIVLSHIQVGMSLTISLADIVALEETAEKERSDHIPMPQRTLPEWTFHTLGAIRLMMEKGVSPTGMNLLLTSNVPHGAGMSNSAANCVAVGIALNSLYPSLELNSDLDVATFARSSENSKFAGGCCGWLDQLLIVCSKKSMVTMIDYSDRSVTHFESKLPTNMQFIAFNTNVPHVLAESDYSHRVKELTLGIKFLSQIRGENVGSPSLKLGTYNALIAAADPSVSPITIPQQLLSMKICEGELDCELDSSEIDKIVTAAESNFKIPEDIPLHKGLSGKISFARCLRRMRHQKMSSLLVPLAGEAATRGDAQLFGLLLDTEGKSLRMSGDFMITGDNGAQDRMLDAAFEQANDIQIEVHGRMLGGGGGGNVLLFADKSNPELYETWKEATCKAYNTWAEKTYPGKGIRATVIAPELAAGSTLL